MEMDMDIWREAWDVERAAQRANTRTAWQTAENAWRTAWENTMLDEEAGYPRQTAYAQIWAAHRKVLSAVDP